MATPTNVINVPKPEPGSYNIKRPAGQLLQAQTLHFREALVKRMKELADEMQELAQLLAIDPKSVKTEGDVSAYVQKATAILHTNVLSPRKK